MHLALTSSIACSAMYRCHSQHRMSSHQMLRFTCASVSPAWRTGSGNVPASRVHSLPLVRPASRPAGRRAQPPTPPGTTDRFPVCTPSSMAKEKRDCGCVCLKVEIPSSPAVRSDLETALLMSSCACDVHGRLTSRLLGLRASSSTTACATHRSIRRGQAWPRFATSWIDEEAVALPVLLTWA